MGTLLFLALAAPPNDLDAAWNRAIAPSVLTAKPAPDLDAAWGRALAPKVEVKPVPPVTITLYDPFVQTVCPPGQP